MFRLQALAVLLVAAVTPLPSVASDELKTGTLNPSSSCGSCHEEIYSMWKRSMHSAAATDPVFRASYMMAYMETEGAARDVCLRCHAPAAFMSGDAGLNDSASQDGITCDYCHSIVSVDLKKRDQPFQVVLDGVKRGPLGDAESPVHDVARSSLHQSSEFCAGCHEYTNEHGLSIFSTYTEWKASPQAAEGKTCQHCHMPLTPGETVKPSFGIERKTINVHNISGGHSIEQVRKAATVKVLGVRRERDTLAIIEVEVKNVGSGHSIPTGIPTRKLVLDVTLFAEGREIKRFTRDYQKLLLDEQGRTIVEDHRTVLNARAIQQDTRLRPGERRVERFSATVPPRGSIRAEATLRYLYTPKILSRERMSIDMASDRSN
jgi:nitrate/TMAO reductase-like tetraheme cytochrome c subunit